MEIRVGFGGSVVVKDPKQTRIASVSKDHGTSWVQPVNLGDLLPLTKVKVSELFKSSANVIGFDDYGENPSEFEWYIVSSQQDSSSRAYKQMHLCKPLAFHSDAEETLKSSLTPVFTSGRHSSQRDNGCCYPFGCGHKIKDCWWKQILQGFCRSYNFMLHQTTSTFQNEWEDQSIYYLFSVVGQISFYFS